jgi:hypothetical protein
MAAELYSSLGLMLGQEIVPTQVEVPRLPDRAVIFHDPNPIPKKLSLIETGWVRPASDTSTADAPAAT